MMEETPPGAAAHDAGALLLLHGDFPHFLETRYKFALYFLLIYNIPLLESAVLARARTHPRPAQQKFYAAMIGRDAAKPRVTHEAGGRSQDGSVQEAVDREEADRRGVHPAVSTPLTTHPPHQLSMDKSPYLCLIPLSDSLLGYGTTPERGGVFELDMLSKTIVNQMEEDTESLMPRNASPTKIHRKESTGCGLTGRPGPRMGKTGEACCAYVLMVTAVYWVSEAVPLGAAALVPAFLYPLFGVLKSSEVAAEYCKDTTLLLMGVICLAASIEKWNLHKRIALRMVMIAGAKPGMLVLGFMCCTVFLSMWLSNTSTTAMVMPIAEAVLQQLICTGLVQNEEVNGFGLKLVSSQDFITHTNGHLPQAAIEIPHGKRVRARRDSQYPTKRDHMICKCLTLSITYAATIGGLITITGTSTNLIFAEQFNTRYPDAKVINFGTWFIFSFPIAIIMLVLTWLWLHFLFLGCNKKRKTRREMLSEKRIHEEYAKLGPIRKGYRTDATVSVFLGFLLFLIPARRPFSSSSSCRNTDADSESDPLAPMITWKDFQRLMPWEIVILVGGGYALAAGCKSETLQINPLHTLIPSTMCVSFGVMLPVGNPPNAIVFSYGHVKISDMVKAGFGVNLIGVAVVMLAITTWGVPLFDLTEFPAWAVARNVTGSL
ncbi:hypothetical protein F2P81_018582 [Scophthalmus maximus]|uniref:Solute carrier family 13 member 4 n=1 Tax=Scophthalmus maximus TaxID=52904 RepID=A0A6A4S8L8_SCOMX|nr:hypothetical protein F2P81_018582 [Scophthalmus maximus]